MLVEAVHCNKHVREMLDEGDTVNLCVLVCKNLINAALGIGVFHVTHQYYGVQPWLALGPALLAVGASALDTEHCAPVYGLDAEYQPISAFGELTEF